METNVSSLSLPAGDARVTNDVISNPTLQMLQQHFIVSIVPCHSTFINGKLCSHFPYKHIFYRPKSDWFTRSFYNVISTVVVVERVIGRTGSDE